MASTGYLTQLWIDQPSSSPLAATIVKPASPTDEETAAATMLQYQLQRCTGRYYPIVTDAAGTPERWDVISVGDTTLASGLDTSGLGSWGIHHSTAGRVTCVLAGSRPEAIWAAADRYLWQLGIRQWAADPLFVSTPASIPSHAVTTIDEVPAVPHFNASNLGQPLGLPYDLSECWERNDAEYHNHSINRYLTADDYAAYPTIQPYYGGSDIVPGTPSGTSTNPCMHFTSDLVSALLPHALASLATYGTYFLGPSDTSQYCGCSECQTDITNAGGDEEAAYTAQYHALLGALATAIRSGGYPDAWVSGLEYSYVGGTPAGALGTGATMVVMGIRPTGTAYWPVAACGDDDLDLGLTELPADVSAWAAANHPTWCDSDWWDRFDDWLTYTARWGSYDRLLGKHCVQPHLLTGGLSVWCQLWGLQSGGPPMWVFEGGLTIGQTMAMWRIIVELSRDLNADVNALWELWAADILPHAQSEILAYVNAIERMTYALPSYPKSYAEQNPGSEWVQQLYTGAGLTSAMPWVEAASGYLAAAMAKPDLTADETTILGLIYAAFHVLETLLTWTAAEGAPSAEDQTAFLAWYDASPAATDSRTIYRSDDALLRAAIVDMIDYAGTH